MKTRLLILSLLAPVSLTMAADTITPEQSAFFEKKIRPVLVEKCYKCHSAESAKPKGGLRLDTREYARRGGDSGPAVVPGNLDDSLLIEAIRYSNADTAMPPQKNGGKLSDAVIADFETWVKMGAPDPRETLSGKAEIAASAKSWSDYGEATKWWSWQLPVAQTPPKPKDAAWAWGPVDQFIAANLDKKEIKPVADADPATWLRRVYFDLIGLPPRPQEVIDFVKDWQKDAPKAREAAVDKLLATEQFGERWGRHWLDVARYAESSGKDVNTAFPHAWRYRDYVISSFNANKPFDQFLAEQIAGDLLPSKDAKQKAEQTIATGFLALGPKSLNEQNPAQFALDLADEQIDTLSQAFLATTIACARCHDHKFDPIPQREYYALAGIFLSTDTRYGTATSIQNRHSTELIELPAGSDLPALAKKLSPAERKAQEEELAKLKVEREEMQREVAQQRRAGNQNPQPANGADQLRRLQTIIRTGQLETSLKSFDAEGNSKLLCMGVQDASAERKMGDGLGGFIRQRLQERFNRPAQFSVINDSPLFIRGDVEKPSDRVPRGFVSVLTKGEVPVIQPKTSGRVELAEWMISPGNPLTSRVIVNRVWNWIFGRGIVASVDNFGTTGNEPSNPALLDYLALHFRNDQKWNMKALIRELVLSHTYGLSSSYEDHNFHVDPENTLCWRMSPRRLEAECIRDAILTVSNSIDLRPPLGSAVAYLGDGPIGGPRPRAFGESGLTNPQGMYRSVYLPAARDSLPEVLSVFDAADGTLVTGSRESTNTPSQALFLMNSKFVQEQAEKMALKLVTGIPSSGPNAGVGDKFNERVRWAYSLCFSRWPTEGELYAAQAFFSRFPADWEKGKESKSSNGMKNENAIHAAWVSFCRALMASAEFRQLN